MLFALFVALLMVGCGDGSVDYHDLEDRNGVTYLADEETPFTGRAERFYHNGQKSWEGNYKDGEPDGLETHWFENGQKKGEGKMKDGKLMSAEVWKPNGEKCRNTTLKDGNGVLVIYNDDGTVNTRTTYMDGLPVNP